MVEEIDTDEVDYNELTEYERNGVGENRKSQKQEKMKIPRKEKLKMSVKDIGLNQVARKTPGALFYMARL